ncbi:MAG TPA: [Fe-Fe] hydrogenase large subunit C-terminal domain-containing protein [Synergistaceae bacterium]|nr:[Fe-Fe] hydrogenase large subunit C-terminal domain-containing protein [Synergistaceae bacterium]HPJ24956.1 [Fe-Fe] hydrogenase large subunit C-terminal domain-containing protein [Synergistaceae bacterium]HPQ36838.1 [Fe-Fe] hydrogenase large subunit C-terminal domain-containing protein [Synergistaceae bacterium]
MEENNHSFKGIKTHDNLCEGCVNCIKSCPTEAIRVIHGKVNIIPELCIDCGECLRTCKKKALTMNEDDWGLLRSHKTVTFIADPALYAQFAPYWKPSLVYHALDNLGVRMAIEEVPLAFDVVAYATAQILQETSTEQLPLISIYCPAMIRLIQVRFPELIGRLIPTENPLEVAAQLWTTRHPDARLCLMVPCPAKITMVHSPLGRGESAFSHAVSIKRVARDLLAAGVKVQNEPLPEDNMRWLFWAMRGGEAKHVEAFSEKPLRTLSVSGLRNTLDLLQDIELGKLRGLDYVECRICAQGCIGGVGNAESRFLSELRLRNIEVAWDISEEYREMLHEHYQKGKWRLEGEIKPYSRLPLGEDLPQAMARLKKLNSIYEKLPHIDCGACGRPSCFALAEDVVRGKAEITDCIFKLRERISSLASEIVTLSRNLPHTMQTRGGGDSES